MAWVRLRKQGSTRGPWRALFKVSKELLRNEAHVRAFQDEMREVSLKAVAEGQTGGMERQYEWCVRKIAASARKHLSTPMTKMP
eukprot:2360260-Lingulodinium_polyedra.AAC.1